tara:strand:- start:1582 stop:1821 length:240 start_codon:yes stop_codon:yes gene_type:complete
MVGTGDANANPSRAQSGTLVTFANGSTNPAILKAAEYHLPTSPMKPYMMKDVTPNTWITYDGPLRMTYDLMLLKALLSG